MSRLAAVLAVAMLMGCATVREADLDAWKGQPVAELDKHPVFLTVPAIRTKASDGTEIRNYVNGSNVSSCSSDGTVFAATVSMASYSEFTNCMASFAACNNIFYIRNGVVERYTPIGTGGARCYTDERLRPGFNSATNMR